MLVNQMRDGRGATLWYFRMSKYCFSDLLHQITPYIQHQNTHSNPIGVLQRPAVVLQILSSGSSHQCVAAVANLFFSPQQVERCFISVAMIERSAQPTNQHARQIKIMSAKLQVLTGARCCRMTQSYVFFT